jgi:hypothetical protein
MDSEMKAKRISGLLDERMNDSLNGSRFTNPIIHSSTNPLGL